MNRPPVDQFSRSLAEETRASVRNASVLKTASRLPTLHVAYDDVDAARQTAAEIKDYTLDHLAELLETFEQQAQKSGIQVHWANDAAEAVEQILEICKGVAPDGCTIVKAKSMATEEIHLNDHLQQAGFEPVETDLGEYVVQIDHDAPSHIVTPIIHKNRRQVAASFTREGLGPYTESPEDLAAQARAHLRSQFQKARVGISGVNFAVAETGRLVIVENEGNNRYSTTAPPVHIAVMGLEKIIPREKDLGLFIRLLVGSSTGQRITSYVHFVSGPRRADEPDGPDQVHLILLDNGRSKAIAGPYRSILRCIRCGACQNACPVYRQASGHAYGHVYSGPIGAVLAPALEGVERLGQMAKASSLCGECEEVCPVRIPIPRMLLQIRDEAQRASGSPDAAWIAYALAATHPREWRTGISVLPILGASPVSNPMKSGWFEFRELPKRRGRPFRRWWHDRH